MITIRSIAYTLTLITFATAPLGAMNQIIQKEAYDVLAHWKAVNNNPNELVSSLAFLTSKCCRQEDYELLIKNVSRINLAQIQDKEGKTPLHHAVAKVDAKNFIDSKVVDVLLKAVKDAQALIATKDNEGNTALDTANFCTNNNAILLILHALEKGDDAYELICNSSRDGWTVMHNAAMWGRCDILELCFALATTPEQIKRMIYLEDFEHNTPCSLATGDAKELIQKYL